MKRTSEGGGGSEGGAGIPACWLAMSRTGMSVSPCRYIVPLLAGLLLVASAAGLALGQGGGRAWILQLPSDPALVYGRGMAEVTGQDPAAALEAARREAKCDLTQSLVCRLRTETIARDEESGGAARASYVVSTTVESDLELVNARVVDEAVVGPMYGYAARCCARGRVCWCCCMRASGASSILSSR